MSFPENPHISAPSSHQEAVEHVESHRDLFEHYARGAIKVLPAPEGLDTFAFDLKTNTIYVNSRFYEDLGFSEEKTTFATLHEIEHLLEKVDMLSEKGGDKRFARYLDRIKESKAFGLMDNCVADIRENRTVVQRTHKGFRDIEERCYKEDLFPSTDFTDQPLHIQLSYALLREARVPDELCAVDPKVREKIDELKAVRSQNGASLLNVMTHPDTPMSTRLALQDKYIWPMVKDLLKEDMEKQKEKREKPGEGDEGGDERESEGGQESEEAPDPNQIFKDAYDESDKRVPSAMPHEEMEKALKESIDKKKDDPILRAEKEYAESIGVDTEALRQYRKIVESLESIRNPETNESVIEELRSLLRRIISKRKKLVFKPQYPVEEGDSIIDPARLVSEVKAGNLEPKVWETVELGENIGQKFGEVELTLVFDRSRSMKSDAAKLVEQRRSAVMILEALKELGDMAEEEKNDLSKPLAVRSEVYTFQADGRDAVPVKRMSSELSEKDRIDTATLLGSAPGSGTTDFISLEAILKGLDEETKRKIKEGELKKIVIVSTDGVSDDVGRVQRALRRLRKDGVVAVGIGITEDGRSALDTYAPDARLAETADKLPFIFEELLKEHLSDV